MWYRRDRTCIAEALSCSLFTCDGYRRTAFARDNPEFPKNEIEPERFSLGLSDISNPGEINLLSGSFLSLDQNSFDMVCASGVIGYAKNQKKTMKTLLGLVKKNGYFVNIEMNETLFGRIVSHLYSYPIMPLHEMKKTIECEGYEVKLLPLSAIYFPANLTRIVFIAKKTADEQISAGPKF